MKTCLECMTTTSNDSLERCNVCGSTEFRHGRPKTGYKMDPTEEKVNEPRVKENISNEKREGRVDDKKESKQDTPGIDYTAMGENAYTNDTSIGKWVLTFIIMAIPVVNIIYAVVVIVQKKVNTTMLNYMKASIIVSIIAWIVSAALGSLLTAMIVNTMYSLY